MLHPILELKEIELIVNRAQIIFSLRIFVFLMDILEANAITFTYKLSNYMRLCPNCIVYIENLNNMNLSKDDVIIRTSKTMASVIQEGKAHEYSIHDRYNIFWKFS